MRHQLSAAVLFFSIILSAQEAQNVYNKHFMLVKVLEKLHYQPRVLNNQWSEDVFINFIDLIDPSGLIFLSADIDELSKYKNQLDDEVIQKKSDFLNRIKNLYKQRLIEADTLIGTLSENPFDFSVKENITFMGSDSMFFSDDRKKQAKRLEKRMKYEALVLLFSAASDSNNVFLKPDKKLLAKEPEIRQKVKMIEKRRINRILNNSRGYDAYVEFLYLYSIATIYDPHSMYFPRDIKESFESTLSAESLSYGIGVSENENGDVIISSLVPGGPAWKSNELHKGDVIRSIKWHNGVATEFTGAGEEEVMSYLESSVFKQMELTVYTQNGQTKTLNIAKEKIEVVDNVINSYVLHGDKTIGYIALPSFYTETENQGNKGCANDIAKEILKLQKEKIEGLIIDLRNNGGGSMEEAIELAGIFIDFGAVCMTYDRDHKPFIYKDPHRGTINTGPLAILVNGMSASASELLAGTLQDYQAAVVIGSPTFGKATAQAVIPVDTSIDLYTSDLKKLDEGFGFVKVTMGNFYRVSGKSHQRKGIIPDIALPEITGGFEKRESDEKYSLKGDSLPVKARYFPALPLPVKELAARSAARISNDESFKRIAFYEDSLGRLKHKDQVVPLDLEGFRRYAGKKENTVKEMRKISERKTNSFSVTANKYSIDLEKVDDFRKESDKAVIGNILTDLYVEEAYKVIMDMILLK